MKACIVLPSTKIFQAQTSHEWTARWINHGIALLIAYAKKEGLQLDLIDTRRLEGWFAYETAVAPYDVVCFSVNTIDHQIYLQCLEHLKKVNFNSVVVVGGVHPTVKLHDFLNDERVNYIIQKEGEVALAKLLNHLRLEIGSTQRIIGTPADLDTIPFIDRDLWMQEYPWGLNFTGKQPFVTILTSRACTQNCSFCQPCAKTMFGNEERRRSVTNVINELKYLDQKYHFKSWMIHDDGFLQNIEWVTQFIEEYKKADFGFRPFIIQCRANYPVQHPELITRLRSIGLEMTIVGFESGSNKILKFIRKGTTREMNIQAAQILRENGVKIFANIMFGVPTETHEDVDLTMSMVKQIKPEHFSAATFSPYPGSDLHDYCVTNCLVLNEYASRYPGEHKIKGIDYEYIQRAIDSYNSEHQGKIKFWLKHSKFPLAKTVRKIYRKVIVK